MKLILVTGMSGAGKSLAMNALEDCGFEAIDNMPLAFLPSLVTPDAQGRHLVVGWDIRSRDFSAEHALTQIEQLRRLEQLEFTMLFLDCDDEILRRRYSETRRRHPLAQDRPVMDGIHYERELLAPLREAADIMIDTSDYGAAALREIVINHFAEKERNLSVVVTSFSFKQGLPRDADMVFDVRFLKNPHYDETLQPKTGIDPDVGAYVASDPHFDDFFTRLSDIIIPLLPRYIAEGKSYLTIAIGCTGGKHRSVFVTEKLAALLQDEGYKITTRHRDMPITISP